MRYRCKFAECGKTLSSPYNLHRHMTCFHMRMKAFVCTCCGRNFGYSHVLKNHLKCHRSKVRRCSNKTYIVPLTLMITHLPKEQYDTLMSVA